MRVKDLGIARMRISVSRAGKEEEMGRVLARVAREVVVAMRPNVQQVIHL